MKIKNKGKIYPSPSSFSSASSPALCNGDVLSVMKLLPAAILALASVLSLEDREVLAYMITRSLSSSNMSSFDFESSKGRKRSSKKQQQQQPGSGGGDGAGGVHKPAVFSCDCWDCYTSYWDRWNSSPNDELISQVIEAFEEHLATGEASSKRAGRGKRREKPGRRVAAQPELPPAPAPASDHGCLPEAVDVPDTAVQELYPVIATENEAVPVTSPEVDEPMAEATGGVKPEQGAVVAAAGGSQHHKVLARKVLPDVLGLLNSRLWNLWSPNV